VDSEGSFTLIQDDAWSKLTEFQLSIEEGWVLKLVQAVSVLPEGALWVKQTPTESTFQVKGGDNWTREAIESQVFNLSVQSNRDLDHMGLAVRILVQMQERPFLIQYGDGERVVWNGHKFCPMAPGEPNKFILKVGHYGVGKFRGAGGARAYGNIAGALRQHCHLSPADIFFGSLRLFPGENDHDMGTPARGKPLGLLPVDENHLENSAELEQFHLPNFGRIEADLGSQFFSLQTQKGLTQPQKVVALFSVFCRNKSQFLARSSRLLWINDGVIVHRESLDIPPKQVAVAVIASSKGLLTDLSGLVPRETDAYFSRRKQAIQAVQRAANTMMRSAAHKPIQGRPNHARSLKAGAFAPLAYLMDPSLGLVALTVAGGIFVYNRHQTSKRDTLNRYFGGLVEELNSLVTGRLA
jgi:hypothetical protein